MFEQGKAVTADDAVAEGVCQRQRRVNQAQGDGQDMLRGFVVQGLAEGDQVFRQGQRLAAGHIDDAVAGVGLDGQFCQTFGNIGKMYGL